MMYNYFIILILATTTCCLATGFSDEERLVNTLIRDDVAFTSVRPAGDSGESGTAVEVDMSLVLEDLVSFDTYPGKIELLVEITLNWTDSRLNWNPAQYGGVTEIRVSPSKIWIPDVALRYGTVDSTTDKTTDLAHVKSNGLTYITQRSLVKVNCDTKDGETWRCVLEYGSRAYNGHQLDLQLRQIKNVYVSTSSSATRDTLQNRNWILKSYESKRNSQHLVCCRENYIDLTFTLNFARRSI